MAVTGRETSLAQFLEMPEAEPALEYWEGMIRQKVSPKAWHGRLQFGVALRLDAAADSGRRGWALPETRCTFGGASFVPDVVFFLRERLPLDADGEVVEDIFAAPDIAIEIASPSQSLSDLAERCQWYVEHGVRISLLIEPRRRIVRFFRAGAEPRVLHGSDEIDLTNVLPEFRLTVAELFGSLRPE